MQAWSREMYCHALNTLMEHVSCGLGKGGGDVASKSADVTSISADKSADIGATFSCILI